MSIRSLIKKMLERYFAWMPTPPGYERILQAPEQILIVTFSRSIILEALLSALSKRHLRGETYYVTPEEFRPQSSSSYLHYVSLHDEQTLSALAEVSRENHSFSISTLNVYRRKGPLVSRPSYKMRLVDYGIVLLSPIIRFRFFLILFGEPKPFPNTPRSSLAAVSRKLKLAFYENLRVVRGTPFQSPAVQQRIILGGKEFERSLAAICQSGAISPERARKRSEKLLRKMAARPIPLVYIPAAIVAKFLLRRIFSDIRAAGMDRVRRLLASDTVVLVPLHRSHLDYIILSWLLYNANLNTPLIAAGVNLSFWPFGPIIRSVGGYFVKRNSQNDPLNNLILQRYVSYLVRRGHLQKFFIEGGRSRSGRMRPPKLGLLQIMVDTYLRGEKRDIVFIPVAITYEQVVEESEFARENTGKEKIEENLRSLFRARTLLRENHKEVLVQFGEPVRLSEFERSRLNSDHLVSELGMTLTRRIRDSCAVSLRALTCTALSLSPRYALFHGDLVQTIMRLARIAEVYREVGGQNEFAPFSPSLQRFLSRLGDGELDIGTIVSREQFGKNSLLFVPGGKRFTADFYRNSVLHLFVPLGLFSISQLLFGEIVLAKLKPLADLLQADLLTPDWKEFKPELERFLELMIAEGLVEQYPNGSMQIVDQKLGHFAPTLLASQIQSYRWILILLASFSDDHVIDYEVFQEALKGKTLVAKYLGATERTEARAVTTLQSALEAFRGVGILDFEHDRGKRSQIRILRSFETEAELLNSIDQAIRRWSLAFESTSPFPQRR